MFVEDRRSDDHYALAELTGRGLKLERDLLGVVPLYYGVDEYGGMYFASEVKALLPYIEIVKELPPAHSWLNGVVKSTLQADQPDQISQTAKEWAGSLREALERSIQSMLQLVLVPGYPAGWIQVQLQPSPAHIPMKCIPLQQEWQVHLTWNMAVLWLITLVRYITK